MEAACRSRVQYAFQKIRPGREQREGHSWKWVTSRASERKKLRYRRTRVSEEEKTPRKETNSGKCVKELTLDCTLSTWGNNILIITVVCGLPKGHIHKQTC